MKNWFIVIVSFSAIAGGLGCAALSQYVTPAEIDDRAVDYAVKTGVCEPNDYAGYLNLHKAIKLDEAVDDAHESVQLDLRQMMERDDQLYYQLNAVTAQNRKAAEVREKQLFGPEGLLTMGLSMAGFGTLTGLVGLMRKRPQDITPEDLKQAVEGKDAKLSVKERQFAELVRGIENIVTNNPMADESMKLTLSSSQSADTKEEVAKVRSKL